MSAASAQQKTACYHCGEDCVNDKIFFDDKQFCCDGCKMVYQLLNQNGLCNYYDLNNNPGISQRISVRKDKFAFLDDEKIRQQLISFSNETQTHITFYLPAMHCSSCLYLLENMHKLDEAIISSKVNFPRKEATVIFNPQKTSLRKIAELLTAIGYEPYISLNDLKKARPRVNKDLIYRLGVAGFCFANIMLLSFPEYLGLQGEEKNLQSAFRILNFILALPVFFYSSMPFYESGWKGLTHKYLNIDAPIALAIIVTFSRSVYEIITGTGAGYLDSMSGIVFFMLVGRVLQDKTYQQLSFERDFTSYFPIAVTVLKDNKEVPTALPDIKNGDTLLIHNEELIPADGILTRGKAMIDYSFVTGESVPVTKEMGEIVYAGGRQVGNNIELLVIKEITQSYLTSLWSKEEFKNKPQEKNVSYVDLLSRYFTLIVFIVATLAGAYWYFHDQSKLWGAVTAVLIIACPCALMLSNTFTNGNILRILGRNKLYLRSAETIEDIANINHIVFDKTGTLTTTRYQDVMYEGEPLSKQQLQAIASLAAQSTHPLSKALVNHLERDRTIEVQAFKEKAGSGIEGLVNGVLYAMGSREFITGRKEKRTIGSEVFVAIEDKVYGYFIIRNRYRDSLSELIKKLSSNHKISVISGDNNSEKERLQQLMGENTTLLFNQKPEDKLHFIKRIQEQGDKVMMVGDGLNDAGALKQSNVGVAIAEDSNNFTPASDAIIEAGQLPRLQQFIRICRINKQIVIASFVLSILYNIVGLSIAVQGNLSPMIAAILMPSSSLSIMLVTFGGSNIAGKMMKL
jgi:Cu+-exporting ATPase